MAAWADSPPEKPAAKEQAAGAGKEDSSPFLGALESLLLDYEKTVRQYNKETGGGSAWYEESHEFSIAVLPTPEARLDQVMRSRFVNATTAMERFRGSHQLAYNQAESLLQKRGGKLEPIDQLALMGLVATLGQSFKRWEEGHAALAEMARSRLGVVLPPLSPPPYLERLRGYMRQTSSGR